jgi:hypothetical protein
MQNNQELIEAMHLVIDFIDGLMVVYPNREAADAHNFLQSKLLELEESGLEETE